jgi:hypothetical protein
MKGEMKNIQHSTFNIEHPMTGAFGDVGRWALNVEC